MASQVFSGRDENFSAVEFLGSAVVGEWFASNVNRGARSIGHDRSVVGQRGGGSQRSDATADGEIRSDGQRRSAGNDVDASVAENDLPRTAENSTCERELGS